MTCGNCPFTYGLCYTSYPPKVKCTITNEFHYNGDECSCEEARANQEEERKKIFDDIVNRPGALMVINYDGPNAPSVAFSNAITTEEAAAAYESIIRLPLYGEADGAFNNEFEFTNVSQPPLNEPITVGSTSCLVCGEAVMVNMWESYIRICPNCQKAIKFVKEKFKNELDSYEV